MYSMETIHMKEGAIKIKGFELWIECVIKYNNRTEDKCIQEISYNFHAFISHSPYNNVIYRS